MKIALVGATGFVGSAIMKEALNAAMRSQLSRESRHILLRSAEVSGP